MLLGFTGSKIIHLFLFGFLPILVLELSFWQWLLGYLIITSTASFLFIAINVGSHITDLCLFAEPNNDNIIQHDWVQHQLATSVDWAPCNKAFIVLTGGANSHAAHHLFPNTAHCHNANLSKIVRKYCNEPGYTYNNVSFVEMLQAHLRLLNTLSKQTT